MVSLSTHAGRTVGWHILKQSPVRWVYIGTVVIIETIAWLGLGSIIYDMSFVIMQEKLCCLMDLLVMEATGVVAAEVVYSGKGAHPCPLNIIDHLLLVTIPPGYQVPGPPTTAK